jgi:hypothetical protein
MESSSSAIWSSSSYHNMERDEEKYSQRDVASLRVARNRLGGQQWRWRRPCWRRLDAQKEHGGVYEMEVVYGRVDIVYR